MKLLSSELAEADLQLKLAGDLSRKAAWADEWGEKIMRSHEEEKEIPEVDNDYYSDFEDEADALREIAKLVGGEIGKNLVKIAKTLEGEE